MSNLLCAQDNKIERADEYFNNLDFINAIDSYQKVVKKIALTPMPCTKLVKLIG